MELIQWEYYKVFFPRNQKWKIATYLGVYDPYTDPLGNPDMKGYHKFGIYGKELKIHESELERLVHPEPVNPEP